MAEILLPLIIGLGLGVIIVLITVWLKSKVTPGGKITDEDALAERLKDSFSRISFDVLKSQSELGSQELDTKKALIDQTLDSIRQEMQKVQKTIDQTNKDRSEKFGELTSQLKTTAETHQKLQQTTQQLSTALASTQVRGQWGERMAEDVLRLAGFVEGINYQKQKTMETSSERPDYTFFLPQNLKVNMDVKFPLNNYMRYLESSDDISRDSNKKQFFRDVRKHITDITKRNYINPEEQTVDYVIVFIPNEQVYGFIHENDRTVLDEALKNKVILCSPLTLYAILAVIRQAVDNFHLEQSANKILALMGTFKKQWSLFVESMDKMGEKIEAAQQEFNKLSSTRRKQLERPLQKIEELREQKGLPMETLKPESKAPEKKEQKPKGIL
ncbi:MAG: DNA recombination protein RmuC [Planctomycetes bacterium]|nr:DNA recombination protein RmuC [Planctomycetota bacterium]